MTTPTTIKIDNVEYVRRDSMQVSNSAIKIIICDRGFVYIGRPDLKNMGPILRVDEARCIRNWGTTQGLSELQDGPTKKTVLDAPCTLYVAWHAVMQMMDVKEDAWQLSSR